MRKMFNQVAQGIARSMANVGQVTTGAKNRHKREQAQQSHEGPNDLISF